MISVFQQQQDVQSHTSFSDGKNSITEMVEAAIEADIQSLIITDHACGWKNSDGSQDVFFGSFDQYSQYLSQIDLAKQKYARDIRLFSGLEIEIDVNGQFKIAEGIRSATVSSNRYKFGVDIILGTIHSESFEEDCVRFDIVKDDRRAVLIKNMVAIIENKSVDIFAHPFQAVHGQFSENLTQSESEVILTSLQKEWRSGHYIYFEINGKKWPNYEQWSYNKYEQGEMETNDVVFLNSYKKCGGKFVFGSDAHSTIAFNKTDFSVTDMLGLSETDQHIFV